MKNKELERLLNSELSVNAIHDYCPNGLQVEGCPEIKRIITGVTASQALIDTAVTQNADAILVHHGYFWKNESPVVKGMKKQRLKTLLLNDINLLAYHLPLDVHPVLGNNAQLAQHLGIEVSSGLEPDNRFSVALQGHFALPITAEQLNERLAHVLQRAPLQCSSDNAPALIQRVAWCTGGGQSYIEQAAEAGVDAFITGEASEQTIHVAREMGIHFFAAGHHATERFGIKALGKWLHSSYGLHVTFIDIENPV
ncbi:MAG: Nif3-like dinuclear metal center hexameric protein [Plesiomonas sp.]|uniref:Nif3-like dinuclear metal center hexameric protein n=1 Tax=Plesiomonas sp. TaxID=2486279 RepID=UPI003F2B08F3